MNTLFYLKKIRQAMAANIFYNVKDYGALGNNVANDTLAIQSAINAAYVNGGTVYMPAGTYKVQTITMYYNVTLIGDGWHSTILKAVFAVPVIEYLNSDLELSAPNNFMGNFQIDGNSIATIGIKAKDIGVFEWSNIKVHHCTQKGIEGSGVLVGELNTLHVRYCPIGFDFFSSPTAQSNLITLNNCQISYNSGWGIKWRDAALITLNNTDISACGTTGVSDSGGLYVTNMSPSDEGIGIVLNECWMEQNQNVNVRINSNNNVCRHSINNTNILLINNTLTGIELYGGSKLNRLLLLNSVIGQFHGTSNKGLIADGANAQVENISSYIFNPSLLNSATLKTITFA